MVNGQTCNLHHSLYIRIFENYLHLKIVTNAFHLARHELQMIFAKRYWGLNLQTLEKH